jgi:hypothetical protein
MLYSVAPRLVNICLATIELWRHHQLFIMLDLVVSVTPRHKFDTVRKIPSIPSLFLSQGLSLGLAYCMYGVSFDPRVPVATVVHSG